MLVIRWTDKNKQAGAWEDEGNLSKCLLASGLDGLGSPAIVKALNHGAQHTHQAQELEQLKKLSGKLEQMQSSQEAEAAEE